ncbi:BMC domain-containing protein [Frisingicoccus sp.]|uniref:BMC domain-containing protein n=1 Tax=Frisingicoccus sp. TaxID=1918627 RepID=UPI00399C4B1B
MIETVGFLELNSIAKGVEAADAILKAAQVELTFAKPVCPGKYSILFTGEVVW